MSLQITTVKMMIQEVGRTLGAGAATELVEELKGCHTQADVDRIVREAKDLLASRGSGIRPSTAVLPGELNKILDEVLASADVALLDRGNQVVRLEAGGVDKTSLARIRGHFKFQMLPPEKKAYLAGLVESALFWVDQEQKAGPSKDDGFKFLASHYGLTNAQAKADSQGLAGPEREKFLRPHQDLFTMFNPYSGNGQENV